MWLRRGDIGIRFGSAWSGTGALLPVWRKAFGRPDCVASRLGCPVDASFLRGTVAFSGHRREQGSADRRSEDSRFAYGSSRELYSNLVYEGFEYNSYLLMSRRSRDLANAETESAKNF